MDNPATKVITETDLESIIDRLIESEETLPVEAIEQARMYPREVTPLLIQLIENATRDCRQGLVIEDDGHFFATYLLAEFQATEAWPAVQEAISLPGEKPFELYEDAITEDFDYIIAALVGDRTDVLDDMIADSSINLYVRWQAADAMLHQIRDGLLTRDQVIRRISRHLQQAIETRDELAEGLVLRLEELGAESELPLIERAFADDLIDPQMVTLDWVKKHIVKGDEIFAETMSRLHRPDDLISHLSNWAAFRSEDDVEDELDDSLFHDSPLSYSGNDSDDEEYFSDNETTVRNETLKVGRNEKCTCGSGKKFKKCCGRASNLGL